MHRQSFTIANIHLVLGPLSEAFRRGNAVIVGGFATRCALGLPTSGDVDIVVQSFPSKMGTGYINVNANRSSSSDTKHKGIVVDRRVWRREPNNTWPDLDLLLVNGGALESARKLIQTFSAAVVQRLVYFDGNNLVMEYTDACDAASAAREPVFIGAPPDRWVAKWDALLPGSKA